MNNVFGCISEIQPFLVLLKSSSKKKRIERFRSIVKFTFIKIKVEYLTCNYLKTLKFHWQQVQEEEGGFIWSKEMFLTNIFL